MAVSVQTNVGIIGCFEITQVSHIPTLNFLSDKFAIKYICDVSENALLHCAAKIPSPLKTIKNAEQLCASNEVDVVLIANTNPFHMPHAILALKHNKYCLLEKPAALNYRDIDALIAAEATSQEKIFVSYMRRYAPAFLEAFSDIAQPDIDELVKREADIVQQALTAKFGVEVTPASQMMLRILGGLGSHDLSAMREILGIPKACLGACLGPPRIWSALLYIEIFSLNKSVKVSYDTPYIKGLPVTLTIREKIEGRSGSDSSGFQERVIRRTYEDAYTLEFEAFYESVIKNKTPKTMVADARNDLDIFAIIMKAGEHNYHSF
ncbi:NAD(P)-binding protein [Zopfia rhizophila CBS 207.26]|uniref:NAD(P)-binding protein n=1 Tax=Zopfia rhizophila CBS 207.26 TaxID=1314779 RepID=A0A6A6E2S7_9PEZI|nr:NAD(P)-binding protein [Zopfia rhizophila CBS 207.26]